MCPAREHLRSGHRDRPRLDTGPARSSAAVPIDARACPAGVAPGASRRVSGMGQSAVAIGRANGHNPRGYWQATRRHDMATITGNLSDWACSLRYEDLPAETVEAAKRSLYDSIGCALGGYGRQDCRILLRHLDQMGGQPHCTLIGSGVRSSPVDAALYNALAIRAMDYNDTCCKADSWHRSDLIPAATSICEWKGLSGRELIVGIVLAYEMEMRYCEAAEPGIRERGWHHATLTAFVTPMVASRMLGLSAEQMQNAIGIAASGSCTLGAVAAGSPTMMENIADPMAVQAGVRAALLAAEGYSGPEHVLEGAEGLVHCLGPNWHLERLTDGLGERFRITDCVMRAFPVEEIRAKFESLIPGAYSSEQRTWIQDAILSLEEVEDVGELMTLLVPEEERRQMAVDEVHEAVQTEEAQREAFEAAVERELKARVRATLAKARKARPAAKKAAAKKAKRKPAKPKKAKARKKVAKAKRPKAKKKVARAKKAKAKRKVTRAKKKARVKKKVAKKKTVKARRAKRRVTKKAARAKKRAVKGRKRAKAKKRAAKAKKKKRSRRR